MSEDCKISIAPNDRKIVSVAKSDGNFQFTCCEASSPFRQDLMGIYIIKIRIDGKMGGIDIKPQFFDGYLYVENYLGETGESIITATDSSGDVTVNVKPSMPKIYTYMIFEKGDWKNDEKLQKRLRK